MAKVFIKERKARPFWFGHPWVFSGAIDRVKGRVADGDVVELCDHKGNTIGEGFYNGRSQIRVRLVARPEEGPLDEALIRRRLNEAIDLRIDGLRLPEQTSAFRIVHSEGDGLPGLIVDKLDDVLVLQISCLGLVRFVDAICDGLESRLHPKAILERGSAVAKDEEGLDREEGILRGTLSDHPVVVHEAGLQFVCDPRDGQKTGFYSDQRVNRIALAPLAKGRSVMDAFCYSGAFALHMAKAGASEVHALDSSESALDLLQRNLALNGLEDRITHERGNVLRVFEHYAREGRTFDLVVIDPPKFVHKRSALKKGLRLYHEVNSKAVQILNPGGVLVTCSCSQHVLEDQFEEMLASVAHSLQVRMQEVYRGGQGPDHPMLYPMTESRYLKCRAVRVWTK